MTSKNAYSNETGMIPVSPGYRDDQNTRNTAGSSYDKENANNGRNRSSRRGNTGRFFLDISNKDFVGDTPEIGGVVGLKSEKIAAKVQFNTFREKVSDFILRELTNGMDVVAYIKDMEDPTEDFISRFLSESS